MESNIPIAASRGVRIDISPVPPLVVRGDRRRLEQVFFNLVGNAVKFTPDGGRVSLVVRALGDAVEVSIADNGAGIPPEFLPHVFDPFRQADPVPGKRSSGVGLGLSIARELVDAHKGQIRAESDGPGRGSTFVVTLPAVGAPPAETATIH
jgi:signal transduction histidine kinase